MNAEKPKRGVVILLQRDRAVLLTSDLDRHQAARLIRKEKKRFRPLKFFPVDAAEAAEVVHRVNKSGIFNSGRSWVGTVCPD